MNILDVSKIVFTTQAHFSHVHLRIKPKCGHALFTILLDIIPIIFQHIFTLSSYEIMH